jgi:DNA-3-methyladenine glycosylase
LKIEGFSVRRLRHRDLPEETVALARFLIGKLVVRRAPEGTAMGRIVETEAYLPYDAAAHTFIGETPRNRPLFLRHGHAYVYLAYGTSWMLNVSSEKAGVGAGVLIRALEPLAGIQLMRERRGTEKLLDLARGPGRVAQALAIDRRLDGVDLSTDPNLWLGDDGFAAAEPSISVRIGITKDAHRPLRFFVRGSRFVSGTKALNG